ncbi:dihydroorotate oxidase [Staphylothermus hellenicus]|uniref:Dihydroorotate dehydrogenase, electron transfer subunit, iron-sulfur cluster binding domain protein n=1 Tax=Staphylothermus hellenicus (strain DSM 12710 / JCM 10830 / BK20S6-10-b1 / P8) TaxID=591019 RepID=D7DB09_STAHD|nr:dihydroorotate oxidase [Staphylothermus hellenicus]ADI31356.1 Dihydroorotate dehydrogenase, electron transfer subunit, iron-sulfur cluster binding domain protein [Staphylothermus hellenicus DSM 12710]
MKTILKHSIRYYSIKLLSNNKISSNLYLLMFKTLDKPVTEPKPPQFIMLWVPGYEAIPMSVAGFNGENNTLSILVKPVGPTTKYLASMSCGSYLGMYGFLGREYIPPGNKFLFIAGGSGLAPILYYLKYLGCTPHKCHVLFGCWRRGEIGDAPRLISKLGGKPYTACLGECDYQGTILDAYTRINLEGYDAVIVSGPPEMIKNMLDKVNNTVNHYFILEETIKCGIGLCGKCSLGKLDKLLCIDGPLFNYEDTVRVYS